MKLFRPDRPCGTGVLVLAGSSGRIDYGRAELLSGHGALCMPLQWFGASGLQPGPWEVPIETFLEALDILAPEVDQLAIVGTSFGAEAALITGSIDQRVNAVAAFAPTSVAWSAYDSRAKRATSKWTYGGEQLPCLHIRRPKHMPAADVDGYLPIYEYSIQTAKREQLESATISTEKIAEILLVSGGDDKVWPPALFAEAIQRRRTSFELETDHVYLEAAGHRAVLPGEEIPPTGLRDNARGGSPAADAELGRRAWQPLRRILNLNVERS